MTKTFKIAATLGLIGFIQGCSIPIADPDNPTRGIAGNGQFNILEATDDDQPVQKKEAPVLVTEVEVKKPTLPVEPETGGPQNPETEQPETETPEKEVEEEPETEIVDDGDPFD